MKSELKDFKPKCLIVDDLMENLIALKSLLKDENIQVIEATSGIEALDLLLQHDFALALVDVQMPNMDGFELAEIMRSTEKTRNIPIIFVTAAEADSRRVFQGYEAGAVDFLQKPLAPQIVLGKVRIFLELFEQKVRLQNKLITIKETEASLKKALRSRDEFLSICSHELKTPLTTLKMLIQITDHIKERKGPEEAFTTENMEKFLNQADRSVDRIIRLVNDMLDISRISTGRLSLNLEQVLLDQLLYDVAERLNSLLTFSGCDLRINTARNVIGLWDKFRLEQVLTNLLTNAAKYAPNAPVDVILTEEGSNAVLKVQDHGKGIPEEDQKRIFERFVRAVTSNSVSGLGLGLYISKEIVELHHGKITVESIPGKGTTFTIILPLI